MAAEVCGRLLAVLTFIIYLFTGLATLLPILWIMLGAWTGVPQVWSQYVAGTGSCLLIVAAYLTLFDRRAGAVFATAGLLATVSFWVFEPIKALRVDAGSRISWTILLVYVLVAGFCAVRVRRELSWKSGGVDRGGRNVVVSVSTALLVCLVAAGQWQHVKSERHPSRYVLPDGYVGWVVVHFNHPGAAPIELRDKELLFKIPESGVLYTSSEQEYGEARDHYLYRLPNGQFRNLPNTGWGKGGMVWDESSGTIENPGAPDDHTEQFFIGTEEQEKAMQNLPNTWQGIVPGDLREKLH